ncbi:hypothetical protein PG993_007796 [Apiospora rasikravindrae]|uniref:Uncharacterized protein n=1 Tax=Apiospora rasikravindrae TaxID=990691 RepID=A0ABR1SYI2_9PEZI
MGDPSSPPDINVSNGTCYYTEHEKTKGNFIACGNVAFGHWPCCQAGDMCLSLGNANGCWDSDTGNTYLAGCTDAGFNARACPWKSPLFHEQEWVAIQQCHPGIGDDDTIWGGCKVDANQTTLEKLPHASCDPYCSSSVMVGASVLPAFASLPSSAGGSIKWTSGFDPTATAAGVKPANATVTPKSSPTPTVSSSAGSFVTAPPTATETSPPPAATATSDGSGLTVGAKAGIGVGAAGAALLIVAVVLLGLLVRRRRQRKNSLAHLKDASPSHPHPHPHPHPYQYDETPDKQQQQQEQVMYYNYNLNKTLPPPTTTVRPTLNSQDSQPFVGYKAELSADEAQQKRPWDQQTGFKSELAADEPLNEIGSSGGQYDINGTTKSESRTGGTGAAVAGGEIRGSSGAHHGTPGNGGGGLSPYSSPHPSSAATAHSPFSAYSEVSTLYASSGGSNNGGTGRWASPTPPQQHQQQHGHGDHPLEQEWPLPDGHSSPAHVQSFKERHQVRGRTWRSHGYDPS